MDQTVGVWRKGAREFCFEPRPAHTRAERRQTSRHQRRQRARVPACNAACTIAALHARVVSTHRSRRLLFLTAAHPFDQARPFHHTHLEELEAVPVVLSQRYFLAERSTQNALTQCRPCRWQYQTLRRPNTAVATATTQDDSRGTEGWQRTCGLRSTACVSSMHRSPQPGVSAARELLTGGGTAERTGCQCMPASQGR